MTRKGKGGRNRFIAINRSDRGVVVKDDAGPEELERRYNAYNRLRDRCPSSRLAQLPKDVAEALVSQSLANFGDFELSRDNFAAPLEILLKAEEIHEQIHLRKFDKNSRTISCIDANSQTYSCSFHGLSRGLVRSEPGDQLILFEQNEQRLFKIVKIKGDAIEFKSVSKKGGSIAPGKHKVALIRSGTYHERCLDAVYQVAKCKQLMDMIFTRSTPKSSKKIDALDDDSSLNDLDPLQRGAIRRIVQATSKPYAYLIFGPPGTGKTTVLEEAAIQIYERKPQARILICSRSNICVDDLAEQIYASNQVDSMARFGLALDSYGKKPKYSVMNLAKVKKCRLVVTTNILAHSLARVYDYVFIDEAAHSIMPETLIPMTKLKPGGMLVLTGDDRQLGPPVRCEQAAELGLKISLLEYVQFNDIYTEEWGQRFCTELTYSYRCDERILSIVNNLYYDRLLVCQKQTPQKLLDDLQLTSPLVFVTVEGQQHRLKEGTSLANREEAQVIVDFLFKLYDRNIKPDQVGVITPYRLQTTEIKIIFNRRIKGYLNSRSSESPGKISRNLWRPKIASVDAFQGSEREIMIVSTVRSQPSKGDRHDFFNDRGRFNVTISRAKYLLVVFGQPEVLRNCEGWRDFLSQAECVDQV